MGSQIAETSHEDSRAYIQTGALTKTEIEEKITSHPHPSSAEKLDLAQAARRVTGGGVVTGHFRTALRHMKGLRSIPRRRLSSLACWRTKESKS